MINEELTGLDQILAELEGLKKKRPAELSQAEKNQRGQYKNKAVAGKPANSQETGGKAADNKSLVFAWQNMKKEREEARRILREYQENTKRANSSQIRINKGILAAEDPISLLLIAIDGLGTATNNRGFILEAKENIRAIYGYGLGYKKPLETEAQEIQQRLEKLKQAEAAADPENRARIKNAIRQHQDNLENITKKNGAKL